MNLIGAEGYGLDNVAEVLYSVLHPFTLLEYEGYYRLMDLFQDVL